eukprot:379200-Rhodomonas_salina.1
MPEPEQDSRPWEGPGSGNRATAPRAIQTGTSLTHLEKRDEVELGEWCNGHITAGICTRWGCSPLPPLERLMSSADGAQKLRPTSPRLSAHASSLQLSLRQLP